MYKLWSGIESGLQILEIELTNSCNLTCAHCYVDKSKIFKISKEKVVGLIKQAAMLKVSRLVFTGGEPLLVKEIFDYAIFAKKLRIPQVVLMTNGILINQKNILDLKVFDLIQLSIDVPPGEKPQFRKDYFDDLLKSINLIKSNKINVSLQATLHKSLVPLLSELSSFSNEFDIPIGINRLNLVGSAKNISKEVLNKNELKTALEKVVKIKNSNSKIGCSDPLLFLVDSKRMDLFKKQPSKIIVGGCLAGVSAVYVAANLDVYICPFVRLKIDSVKKKNLSKIWFSNKILNKLRMRKFFGECGSCEYKSFCGGCRSSSLVNEGDLFCSDPLCFK